MSAGLGFRIYVAPDVPAAVHVQAAGGEWYYPLDRDREIEVAGPLGLTRVLIEKGAARVVASPCQAKTCVHSGTVSRTGGWIACLPNRVLVTIEGKPEVPYDAESF